MTNNKAYTLVEIMIGILIVSLVIIGGFKALTSVTVGKARLIVKTDIQKESLYFTEKFFEMIKKGGTTDYEEYFNRKVIGNTTFDGGHYSIKSGFGNFGKNGVLSDGLSPAVYGDGFYYCRSGSDPSNILTSSGCYNRDTLNTESDNFEGEQQRYLQYFLQFIDYNSNHDSDGGTLGDEDGDGLIVGDNDDEYVGSGPFLFNSGDDIKELYLVSGNKKTRTLFRWNVKLDPHAGTNTCDIATATGPGCLGTIEYLVLDGKDYGLDHIVGTNDISEYDGIIDTWLIGKDFTGGTEIIAGSDDENYWLPLFPDTINVSDFKVILYPNQDIDYSWKDVSIESNISPYVELKIKLKPSFITRNKLKGELTELDFSMTISLSEIYSQ